MPSLGLKGITADAVRDQVSAAAGLDPQELDVARHKIRLTVERRRLRDLAAIRGDANVDR